MENGKSQIAETKGTWTIRFQGRSHAQTLLIFDCRFSTKKTSGY